MKVRIALFVACCVIALLAISTFASATTLKRKGGAPMSLWSHARCRHGQPSHNSPVS